MPTSPGRMLDRLTFQSHAQSDDGAGNLVAGDWTTRFTRYAEIKVAKGGEEVLAARLQGTQPVTIIVTSDSETRTITPDWQAVDARSGVVYAIRTVADLERRRQWITMDAVAGVAA